MSPDYEDLAVKAAIGAVVAAGSHSILSLYHRDRGRGETIDAGPWDLNGIEIEVMEYFDDLSVREEYGGKKAVIKEALLNPSKYYRNLGRKEGLESKGVELDEHYADLLDISPREFLQ